MSGSGIAYSQDSFQISLPFLKKIVMHYSHPRLTTYRQESGLGGTKKCPNASSIDEKVEFPAVYFFLRPMKFSFIRKRILISCSGFSQIKCTFASIVSTYKFVLSSIFLILIWTMPHLAKCARPPTPTPPLKQRQFRDICEPNFPGTAVSADRGNVRVGCATTQNRINIGKSLVRCRSSSTANSMIIHLNRIS